MGLNLRQCIFSLLAILVAVGIYFGLGDYVGQKMTGWLCILGAAPFAACGFFQYHGMNTVYIFVDEKNSKRPMQYNTVQNKVMDLIQKKDLRDDHGELFGFGTHMFRHVYGIRLTELHLDDWTIAKLLGHTSVKNVKFYRKMSLQIIADETREIRAEMSRMIRANLAGWGKEYEQI